MVTIFSDADFAIQSLKSKIPDIILLDVLLPDLNGFDAYLLFKDNQMTTHVPIIFQLLWVTIFKGYIAQ